MSTSMKAMLAGAALAGLLTGTSAKLQAQTTNQNQNAGIRAVSMQDDGGTDTKTDKDKLPKHACKGQNACKGQGGGDKDKVHGKNDCKGKGGCATDGSKPPKDDKSMVINPSSSRTNALQPQWVGVECPGPLFFLEKLTCQQILSTDSPILELG